MDVAILGAGAMGTTMALIFERAGHRVTICGTAFDEEAIATMRRLRSHPVLQQTIARSIDLASSTEWATPVAAAEIVVIAVSSAGFRSVVTEAAPSIGDKGIWAIATKGWDPESAEPLSKTLASLSPDHPVVVVVGPSIAVETAGRTPTGLVCASRDIDAAYVVATALASPTVRTYISDDVAGVEVGAALKNVLAIAVGMCDGLSQVKGISMNNTKAALFSRGLVEMARLATALGGRQETVLGLAGAGDLFVTVNAGRNGRFGRLVGTGLEPERAFREMGTTVEGFDNAREAKILADRHSLDLPVVQMVYSVLHEGVSPDDALAMLVLGPVEQEI